MTKLRGLIVLVLLSLVLLGAPGLAQDFEPGKNTVMVPMKDGVGLATDIWLPEGDGPWPVVMARTPYDKNPTAGGEFNAITRDFGGAPVDRLNGFDTFWYTWSLTHTDTELLR